MFNIHHNQISSISIGEVSIKELQSDKCIQLSYNEQFDDIKYIDFAKEFNIVSYKKKLSYKLI